MATPLAILALVLAIYAIADREVERRADAKRLFRNLKRAIDPARMEAAVKRMADRLS